MDETGRRAGRLHFSHADGRAAAVHNRRRGETAPFLPEHFQRLPARRHQCLEHPLCIPLSPAASSLPTAPSNSYELPEQGTPRRSSVRGIFVLSAAFIALNEQRESALGKMVGREGFEPSKAMLTDLQSAPFDRSGTYPYTFGRR